MQSDRQQEFCIEVATLKNSDEILQYILNADTSLIYSSPHFLSLISAHLKVESGWLVARDKSGSILGVLPFSIKLGELGPVYNSFAYYGSNGGVIQLDNNPDIKNSLIQEFYKLAESNHAVSATIITNPLLKDHDFYEVCLAEKFLRDERIGQITHLPDSADGDALISLFDAPRPRNIRRAQKEGIIVKRRQDQESIDFLYQTHFENLQAIGGLAKDYSFFQTIPEIIPTESWAIYTAYKDEKPIAALLLLYFNRTVEYFTPVIVEEHRNSQPLALIIYEAMGEAIELGFKNWNWGGTWLSQGGVYDFKKRWGTTNYPYYYYTKIFRDEILEESKSFFIEEYNGFYVVPFSALKGVEEKTL